MKKQSVEYERAKSMVLSDKFNFGQSELWYEMAKLIGKYMEFDALTAQTELGSQNNMIITISVKKVKPTFRPLS